eukprot:CAMPEP_0174893672 /NCGR_PEP_ID=MMETSP0167-20121228/8470_1 /TAXON_ID=38298 /ORGANISM="Rhodella maculata, Strain CCMP736" /LENGTH=50 /DNA_ID=CAMNT_0016132543 /DNA_START=145 /DNA_END=293 /DNA_ORIENTATION=+
MVILACNKALKWQVSAALLQEMSVSGVTPFLQVFNDVLSGLARDGNADLA